MTVTKEKFMKIAGIELTVHMNGPDHSPENLNVFQAVMSSFNINVQSFLITAKNQKFASHATQEEAGRQCYIENIKNFWIFNDVRSLDINHDNKNCYCTLQVSINWRTFSLQNDFATLRWNIEWLNKKVSNQPLGVDSSRKPQTEGGEVIIHTLRFKNWTCLRLNVFKIW